MDTEALVLSEIQNLDQNVILGMVPGRIESPGPLVLGAGYGVRSGSVIYLGSNIGKGLQTGHNVVIREENTIGDNFRIWSGSVVDYGCVIGNDVKIHTNVYVSQYTTIEDHCFLAPGVGIANDLCPECGECMKGPTLRKGVRVGVNATLLPHVVIGEYSLIAAGAVVVRDVPPRSLVVGNPGKVLKSVDEIICRFDVREHSYENDPGFQRPAFKE